MSALHLARLSVEHLKPSDVAKVSHRIQHPGKPQQVPFQNGLFWTRSGDVSSLSFNSCEIHARKMPQVSCFDGLPYEGSIISNPHGQLVVAGVQTWGVGGLTFGEKLLVGQSDDHDAEHHEWQSHRTNGQERRNTIFHESKRRFRG